MTESHRLSLNYVFVEMNNRPLGFGVEELGFRVRVWGLEFRVED